MASKGKRLRSSCKADLGNYIMELGRIHHLYELGHDGWKYCECELAQFIRMLEKRANRRAAKAEKGEGK
jgi:uncharacterized protein YjhX (UPF0386 family)